MNEIHVPFNTVKEDYNEYRMENGQILRVKSTPVDFILVDKEIRVVYKDVSYVITPYSIDRSGLELGDPATVTEKDVIGPLQFKPVKEMINIYETEQSMIFLTPKVEKIFSTRKKDMDNNPIIRYTMKTIIDITQKATTTTVKQEVKASPRVWMFRKRGTAEGIVACKKGNYFTWAKTYNDEVVGDYTNLSSEEFENMLNRKKYDLDENTFFTFTNQGFKFIRRNSPFDKTS